MTETRRRGRPPGKDYDARIDIRMSGELKAALEALAERLGRPAADVARDAIAVAVARGGGSRATK